MDIKKTIVWGAVWISALIWLRILIYLITKYIF